jgi:hypothetical protein
VKPGLLGQAKKSVAYVPALLLGSVAFWLVTGGRILNPRNVDWLMVGDPATQWLGWQFFRHSPLLQWPLGANPDYGSDIGSSVVFTDSIPLLAFFFKPFSGILPDTFQYFGLWILLCFLLQSVFAWKLLSLFTQDKWLSLVASVFFTLAPVFLFRLIGHYALFGHWVLLAGLYLYFSERLLMGRWVCLLTAAALIHAYLLALVGTIWAADFLQRCVRREIGAVIGIPYVLGAITAVSIVIWAAGYFMVGGGVHGGIIGHYRMNLLSLVDPDVLWSRVLRDQPQGEGDYEGFNFLGIGVLVLAAIATYEVARSRTLAVDYKRVAPLFFVSVGLLAYALSPRIAIGEYEWLSYGLPAFTEVLTGPFRASGRFFWPVYYLIFAAVFYVVFLKVERRTAITLCVLLLAVQIADSSAAFQYFRQKLSRAPAYTSVMQSPAWNDMARRYERIVFVLPHNIPPGWLPLARFASDKRMAINIGYYARVDFEKVRAARERIGVSIVSNELDPRSLYVFENDGLWDIASNQLRSTDIAGVLDGFRIVAPRLQECADCDKSAIAAIRPDRTVNVDYRMEPISFSSKGTGSRYLMYGWSVPEEWGTWSDGDTGALLLRLPASVKGDLDMMIEAVPFVGEKHPIQEVEVLVNKTFVDTIRYESPVRSVRSVRIPGSLLLAGEGRLLIQFKFMNARSPAEVGLSSDVRKFAFRIVSMQLASAGH